MFGEFMKMAFAIGGPLLVVAGVVKGIAAAGPVIVALLVIAGLYGAARGFAEADAYR